MTEPTLTAAEQHQLLAVLRELDPSAPPEQRRASRRKVFVRQWIRRVGGGRTKAPVRAVLVNVSARGAGLVSQVALARGEKFVTVLTFREGTRWLVLCQVRNGRKLRNGLYQVGAAFLDRVEDLGDGHVPADWVSG